MADGHVEGAGYRAGEQDHPCGRSRDRPVSRRGVLVPTVPGTPAARRRTKAIDQDAGGGKAVGHHLDGGDSGVRGTARCRQIGAHGSAGRRSDQEGGDEGRNDSDRQKGPEDTVAGHGDSRIWRSGGKQARDLSSEGRSETFAGGEGQDCSPTTGRGEGVDDPDRPGAGISREIADVAPGIPGSR